MEYLIQSLTASAPAAWKAASFAFLLAMASGAGIVAEAPIAETPPTATLHGFVILPPEPASQTRAGGHAGGNVVVMVCDSPLDTRPGFQQVVAALGNCIPLAVKRGNRPVYASAGPAPRLPSMA